MIAQDTGRRVPRRITILAGSLWLTAASLTAAALYISHLDGSRSEFGADLSTDVALLSFATIGAVLAWRRPRNTLGWLYLAIPSLFAIAFGSGDYATYALAVRPGEPLGPFALWVNVWIWIPALGLAIMVVPLLLPEGRLPSARWRPYLWFTVIMGSAYTVINMVAPITADNYGLPSVRNPYGVPALQSLLAPLLNIGDFLALLFVVASLSSLVVRYRHGGALERGRLAWLFAGLGPAILFVALVVAGSWMPALGGAGGALYVIAVAAVPVATLVAVLRPQVLPMDRIVRRAVAFAVIPAALAGLYAALAVAAHRLLPPQSSALALTLPAVALALVARPLRRGTRRLLEEPRREGPGDAVAESALAADARSRPGPSDVQGRRERGRLGTLVPLPVCEVQQTSDERREEAS